MTETSLLFANIGALVSEDSISCLDHVAIVIGHQIEIAHVQIDVLLQYLILLIDLSSNGLLELIQLSLILREILNEWVISTLISMHALGVC